MFEDQSPYVGQFDNQIEKSARERSLDVALKLCKGSSPSNCQQVQERANFISENVLFLYPGLNLSAETLRLIT